MLYNLVTNDRNLVIIGIIIVIINSLGSLHLYSTSSISGDGIPLNFFDTIKNIFGFLPSVLTSSVNTLGSVAKTTTQEIENELKNFVKKIPENVIKARDDITDIAEDVEEGVEEIFKKKEVFNVDKNIFSYEQAPLVCKALGADLATYDQVNKAYKNGAHWCNYGWTDNQMALFPIQAEIYKNMTDEEKGNCGKPGINGGFFNDKSIEFGVNCYGYKKYPDPAKIVYLDDDNKKVDTKIQSQILNDSPQKQDIMEKYNKLLTDGKLEIKPFNTSKWSKYSYKKSVYMINPDTTISDEVDEEDKNPNSINSLPPHVEELVKSDFINKDTAVACYTCFKGCDVNDKNCRKECTSSSSCIKSRSSQKYKAMNDLAEIKYNWTKSGKSGSFEQANYLGNNDEFKNFYNQWKEVKDNNGNISQWIRKQMSS